MRFTASALLAAAALNHIACANNAYDDLLVDTPVGRIYGGLAPGNNNVRQFLGIPYAAPPLGELRFAPTQSHAFLGEFAATQMGPSCMQRQSDAPSIINAAVPHLGPLNLDDIDGWMSENCLTLNIWTPRVDANWKVNQRLPVYVFFHGGGFQVGGSNAPYFNPVNMLDGRRIVVTFNYRQNIFGFPNAAGLPAQEQNLGLLDQRQALTWVKYMIDSFGGNNQTIGAFGHGSGATSIAYLTYTDLPDVTGRSVIKSAILASGNEFTDILARDPKHTNFTYVATQVRCGGLDPGEELDCMRRADVRDIQRAVHGPKFVPGLPASPRPPVYFAPVVDEKLVLSNYSARTEPRYKMRVPTLMGTARNEGAMFVPYPTGPAAFDRAAADRITRERFHCPTLKALQTRLSAGIPVYRYLYSGNFSNISPEPWMGAFHGSELPLLFGTHLLNGPPEEAEARTSSEMQQTWLDFMERSGAGPGRIAWQPWDGTARASAGRRYGSYNVAEIGSGSNPMNPDEMNAMDKLCG